MALELDRDGLGTGGKNVQLDPTATRRRTGQYRPGQTRLETFELAHDTQGQAAQFLQSLRMTIRLEDSLPLSQAGFDLSIAGQSAERRH